MQSGYLHLAFGILSFRDIGCSLQLEALIERDMCIENAEHPETLRPNAVVSTVERRSAPPYELSSIVHTKRHNAEPHSERDCTR